MKATTAGHQRQPAGFAISDILDLNDRSTESGLESPSDRSIYQHPQDLTSGQTLIPPPSRHWALPSELGKFQMLNFSKNSKKSKIT